MNNNNNNNNKSRGFFLQDKMNYIDLQGENSL